MDAERGFWLQLMLLAMVSSLWLGTKLLLLFRQWHAQHGHDGREAHHLLVPSRAGSLPAGVAAQAVPGAGIALAQPPDLAQTLDTLTKNAPSTRYRIPLGWSCVDGRAALSQAALVGDINHILLTAQSDGGKDNWAIGVLLSLAWMHPATELQLCVIDGKGLDFVGWRGLPHSWRLALSPDTIAPAMRALSAERERRRQILSVAGVSKWEAYRGGDLPLLVTYVSELALLQDATSAKDLERWLNSELAAGRAFGMRYIVATQTASNFATRWRAQISLAVAGFQPSQSQDTPNTGLRSGEIARSGAVPPSALPAPPLGVGVFCVVHGRDAVNIRAPLVDDGERRRWLEALRAASSASAHPDAEEALPTQPETAANPALNALGSGAAPLVSEAERQAIIAAAQLEPSRRKVCQRVFGTTGGRAWEKVKQVCDQERLMVEPYPSSVLR